MCIAAFIHALIIYHIYIKLKEDIYPKTGFTLCLQASYVVKLEIRSALLLGSVIRLHLRERQALKMTNSEPLFKRSHQIDPYMSYKMPPLWSCSRISL